MAISSKLVISGGPISELDRRKRRRTSYNKSTATATATTTEVIELSLMGQNPLPSPVIDNKNESVQSPKNTKNQQDDTINTTNNITTTTTNNNSTLNNNTNNNTHNNTNSKTLTNSALKPTSTLPASTSTSTSTKTSISKTSIELSKYNIIHDPIYCMFKILLDTKGNTAALCYLPTRFRNIVEFYHIEIPAAYRNLGLGDLLLCKAFEWAEKSKMMVIPSCPFVLQFLSNRYSNGEENKKWSCIVANEKETPPI